MKLHHAQSTLLSYRRRPISIVKHVMQWKMDPSSGSTRGLHRGDGDTHVKGNPVHRLLVILSLAIMPLSSLFGGIFYLLACLLPMPISKADPETFFEKPKLIQRKPLCFYALMGFCLLSLLPLLFSANPLWHLTGWLSHYALPALLIYGQLRGLKSGRFKLKDILTGLLAGSGLLAGVGLLNYFCHWQTHTQLICFQAYGGFCLLDLLLLAEDRARSFSMHPNVLGALMSLAIPIWLYAIHQAKSTKMKLGATSGLVLILLCLLVSFSRTAWISGGFSLLMSLALFNTRFGIHPINFSTKMDSGLRRNDKNMSRNDNSTSENEVPFNCTKNDAHSPLSGVELNRPLRLCSVESMSWSKNKATSAIVLALTLPFLLILTPYQVIVIRLQSLGLSNGSGQTRWQLWQAGWQMLQEHLWLGTGILHVEPLLKSYLPVIAGGAGHLHNWYLQVAVESGLPAAMCLFISVFTLLIQMSFKTKNRLGKMAVLMLWSTLIASLFDITLLDFRVLFVLCWACTLAVLDYTLFSRHK